MIESVRIDPNKLCRRKFPEFAALHDSMTTNKGILDRPFDPGLFSYLTICAPKANMVTAPPIVFIGKKSDQRRLFSPFGSDWFKSRRTPQAELEEKAAKGYCEAFLNGAYHCDHNATVLDFPDGKKYVEYYRLIWTYREHPKGIPLIGFLARQLNRVLQ